MKYLLFSFLTIVLCTNFTQAQTKILQGKIINNDGEVIGATVCFGERMDYCATTQREGDFSIMLPKKKLNFNALICYKSIEIYIPACTTKFKLHIDKWHENKRYRRRFQKSLKKQCRK